MMETLWFLAAIFGAMVFVVIIIFIPAIAVCGI